MKAINYEETLLSKMPFYSEYSKYIQLLSGVAIAVKSVKECQRIAYPSDQFCDGYIHLAIHIQSYFINSHGVREQLSGALKGANNILFSDTEKLDIEIGRVIRNKVAHQSLWIPLLWKDWKRDAPLVEYFGFECAEIMSSLEKIENEELKNFVLKFFPEKYSGRYMDIVDFMVSHESMLISKVLETIEALASKRKVQEVSNQRIKCSLPTIDDGINRIKKLRL
jgi:hypothetical protein